MVFNLVNNTCEEETLITVNSLENDKYCSMHTKSEIELKIMFLWN